MARALAACRDVGYPYMLMPDAPQTDGRDPSGAAFAYCYGYIQALLDRARPAAGSRRRSIRIVEPSTGFAQLPTVRQAP